MRREREKEFGAVLNYVFKFFIRCHIREMFLYFIMNAVPLRMIILGYFVQLEVCQSIASTEIMEGRKI